ncbi:competence protein CoiA [Secundilactobacillus silagei]|uniref:Competence protein CoiA n=1 Tax=Secundilactobacillus silagei JCM 19001 TaxID=1302250 RepID=A0A1Z5IJF5_9LACO|nr:competence protein CoiA family protein [Secundilactobacillus silagei]TDG68732.1 hypothetical protein C5L25_001808 [Secundilactobacillus silagei JCM 19001]GAX01819.1 competence protein CoiA [Secundilactobacillus silagei JCM 19001]
MLIARTKQDVQVQAGDAQRKRAYFCPSCQEQVTLKRGTRMVAHFAHRPHSVCRPFSESESQAHLTGKWQLADYFGTDYVELEPYLQALAQRPDLLLKRAGRNLAIEYQCSVIPVSRLQQRNLGYSEFGLEVLWILGADYLQKIKTVRQAEKWLRYSDKLGWYLIFWETRQQGLIIWHHLTMDGTGQLQGWAKVSNGQQYAKNTRITSRAVVQKLQRQVQMGLHYKLPKWLKLQQFCYEHHGLLQAISAICYQFTDTEPVICDSPVIWAALMTILLRERPMGSLIEQADLEKWAMQIRPYFDETQLIQCTVQQVVVSWKRQLQHYVTLLEHQGILKMLDEKTWQLVALPR